MDIFVWGRPLRQVQTCESRDIHILGNLYGDCIIIIIEKRKKMFHLRLIEQERY